jgi:hypothetical protein
LENILYNFAFKQKPIKMKKISKSVLFIALAFIAINATAQRIKTIEGDLSVLKAETTISVEFTYDNMSVGKFDKESDYIDKKKGEYNAKEAGRGDNWAKSWVNDRKMVFEPKFIDLFEKATDMVVKAGAKYTMIFHTTTTEPGYNIYVTKKNAEIDAEVTIVETANRSKVIAVISVKNAPGRTFSGNDYATSDRISECYAVAGKKLGKFIK